MLECFKWSERPVYTNENILDLKKHQCVEEEET